MNHARADFGMTTYGQDKLIVGGGTNMTMQYIPALEQYCCSTDSWTILQVTHQFHKVRYNFSLVNVGNTLMAFGGDTNVTTSYLKLCDVTWTVRTNLPRRAFTAIAVNGKVYLVGGCTIEHDVSVIPRYRGTVSCYDPETHVITEGPGSMEHGRILPGLALIYL